MRRAVSFLLTVSIALSFVCGFNSFERVNADEDSVRSFVIRLYEICLDREPDSRGLDTWTNNLVSGRISGSEAAKGFIFSNEFLSNDYDNRTFVSFLYRIMFDRTPDDAGLNSWTALLNEGKTRLEVFEGFADSSEWTLVCSNYGITPRPAPSNDNVSGVDLFINRLYSGFLGRSADNSGLADWRYRLSSGNMTGASAAGAFIHSPEFMQRAASMDQAQLITSFYNSFLGRTPTTEEIASYQSCLTGNLNNDLETLFIRFTASDEFIDFCIGNGIVPGSGDGASMISDADVTSFFNHSVIIGNSVSDGFNMYFNARGRGIMGNILVCARVSYSLLNDSASRSGYLPIYNGTPMRARDIIRESGARAAFICMGTNDIAGNVVQRYCNYIDDIRSVNPDTIIFIEACTPSRDDNPANTDIAALNEGMRQFCDTRSGVYFIDTNTPFLDSTGRMAARYSSDGNVHMTLSGYEKWCEILSDYVREYIYEQRITGNYTGF